MLYLQSVHQLVGVRMTSADRLVQSTMPPFHPIVRSVGLAVHVPHDQGVVTIQPGGAVVVQ